MTRWFSNFAIMFNEPQHGKAIVTDSPDLGSRCTKESTANRVNHVARFRRSKFSNRKSHDYDLSYHSQNLIYLFIL